MGVATAIARRSDCTRRQVGAVILDTRHRIVGAGYPGTYPGGPSCLAGECPRGRHYLASGHPASMVVMMGPNWERERCACGQRWPCPEAVEPGSSYDTGPGACISVHAEANALLDASSATVRDGTLYCTDRPCDGCWKLIRNSGLARVVWKEGGDITDATYPFNS